MSSKIALLPTWKNKPVTQLAVKAKDLPGKSKLHRLIFTQTKVVAALQKLKYPRIVIDVQKERLKKFKGMLK